MFNFHLALGAHLFRNILFIAIGTITAVCHSGQPVLLVDGRDQVAIQREEKQVPQNEADKYLNILFPHHGETEVIVIGSYYGSFTEPGRKQVLISGFISPPDQFKYSALGIFEEGTLIAKYQEEGSPLFVIGVQDLNSSGTLKILTHVTYAGLGFGETDFQIWEASRQRIHSIFRKQLQWYSFNLNIEQASVIYYRGGPIRKRSSFQRVLYQRPMIETGKPQAAPTTEKPWQRVRHGTP